MSVDVEEHFQVSAFEGRLARTEWRDLPSRVVGNIHRVLDLFAENDTKATFFTLGCVAERTPELVKTVADTGHEIASHGYDHRRVRAQSPDQFREDVTRTKKILEDLSGKAVTGYRAPSFSICEETLWAYDVLQEAGYQYSSSIYPISHDHYGLPEAPRVPFRFSASGLLEIPLATSAFAGRNFPAAGGGYFRLLPLAYSKWAMRRVNRIDRMPIAFYFHPWEVDPDQPRVTGISMQSRFRHYVNLGKFESRLQRVLATYRWDRMDRVFASAIRKN